MEGVAKPVKNGDILELEIDSIGKRGDGIGHKDGFVVFVPNSEKGKRYVVKITSVSFSSARSEITQEA